MANRNVPATPSQEELRKNEIMKNVKNSEERETDSLNSNIDADSLPTVSTVAAVSREARSSTTKIPGPVDLGPSTSTFQMKNRKYSSVLEVLENHQPSVNDSGIQIDSSISDGEATPVPPSTPYHVASFRSEMELQLAEEQTLKELQRVVAEMEAEVALEDEEEEEEEQHQLEAAKAQQASPTDDEAEQGSSQKQAPADLQTEEEKDGQKKNPIDEPKAQQNPVVNEAEQESVQNHVPDNVQDNNANFSQKEEPVIAFETQQSSQDKEPGQESAQQPTEINMAKSKPDGEPLVGQGTTNEVNHDNQPQKLKQIDEPEPVTDPLEPLLQVSEQKLPQIVLEDPSACSVEAHLQQAFENINQSEEREFVEVPVDALIGANRALIDDPNQDLLGEIQPEVGNVDLVTPSEPALVANPSQGNIHLDGSTVNNRPLAPLEELLGNPNNVELLRRLLQIRTEVNIVESDTEFATQETSGEEKESETETESGPGTSLTTATASGTEASTDEDAELDEDETKEQGEKMTASLVRRLLSDKLMGLACPILFCGLAAGLIYLSRKA